MLEVALGIIVFCQPLFPMNEHMVLLTGMLEVGCFLLYYNVLKNELLNFNRQFYLVKIICFIFMRDNRFEMIIFFYGDCVYFLNSVYSWGGKGGPWSDGLLAGSFHFSDSFGALYNTNGSRFFCNYSILKIKSS